MFLSMDWNGERKNMVMVQALNDIFGAWRFVSAQHLDSVRMQFQFASAVCSADHRYIYLCRGLDIGTTDKQSNDIVVFDVLTEDFVVSSLKLPPAPMEGVGRFESVIIRERTMERLATAGYVREQFAKEQFRGLPLMSTFLVNMMGQFVSFEFMHSVQMDWWIDWIPAQHFRIRLDHIEKSCSAQ